MSLSRSPALMWLFAVAAVSSLATSARAQFQPIDVNYGRFSLETLAILSPSMINRPLDMLNRPDARALGMGGAYVAMADDPLGLAWNPAALTGIHSFTLAVDGFGTRSNSTTKGWPTILEIPRLPVLNITSYDNSLKSSLRYGTMALGLPLWQSGGRGLLGGFSFRRYAEVGSPEETIQTLVEAESDNPAPVTVALDRKEKGAIEAYGPSLALRLGAGLDLGVTANFLSGRNRVSESFERETGGQGESDLGLESFTLKYRAFALDFGVRFSLKERVRVALRYTPEYDLEVTGGAWRTDSLDLLSGALLRQFGTLSGYDQTVPSFMNVGGAIQPFSRLWLTADYTMQNMSESTLTYTGAPAFDPFASQVVAAAIFPEAIGVRFGPAPAAIAPTLPNADLKQMSFGAEYVLLRTKSAEVPVRVGFRSTDLPYISASAEDYSYRYLHEEVMDFLGITYEELLLLYDPEWDPTESEARKRPQYRTVGLVYNGPHGEQPTGTGFALGVSLRTDRVSYDLGVDWFSFTDTRYYSDTNWDPILNPNPIEGLDIESMTVGEDENAEEVELPARARHPDILEVDRSVTTIRFSATYSFPDLF